MATKETTAKAVRSNYEEWRVRSNRYMRRSGIKVLVKPTYK